MMCKEGRHERLSLFTPPTFWVIDVVSVQDSIFALPQSALISGAVADSCFLWGGQ